MSRTRVRTLQSNRRRAYRQILQKYDVTTGNVLSPNPWSTSIVSNNVSGCLYDQSNITDDVHPGFKSKKKRHRPLGFTVGPCTHLKTKVIWNPGYTGSTQTLELQGVSGSVRNVHTFIQDSPNAYALKQFSNSLTSNSFYTGGGNYTAGQYLGVDWFSLHNRFLEALDTFVPMDSMLGETLIEIGIVKDLIQSAIYPHKALGNLIRFVKDIGAHKGSLLKAKSAVKKAAQGTLSWSFGYRPVFQAVGGMLNSNLTIRERFDYLIAHRGGFLPVRARQRLDSSFTNGSVPTGTNAQLYKLCTEQYTLGTISCQAKVRSDLWYSELWKGYMQYYGLNKIAGLAWELIPFSFVVDWFTNTQERINYLTRGQIGSPYTEFRGITYSLKQMLKETVYLKPGFDQNLGTSIVSPAEPVALFDIEKSSYWRYLTCPSTSGVVDISTLGTSHAILGGSLLIQRLLK